MGLVDSYAGVRSFGCAIRISSRQHAQAHVGILYSKEDGELRLLHQASHFRLTQEAAADAQYYVWLDPSHMEDGELELLADLCADVSEANRDGKLPYAFEYPQAPCFDPNRKHLLADDGQGLTCATFVIAVLEAYGYPFLARATWKARAADVVVHRRILDWLRRTDCPKPHLQAIEDNIECVRFRPVEVAAAFLERAETEFTEVGKFTAEVQKALETRWGVRAL